MTFLKVTVHVPAQLFYLTPECIFCSL